MIVTRLAEDLYAATQDGKKCVATTRLVAMQMMSRWLIMEKTMEELIEAAKLVEFARNAVVECMPRSTFNMTIEERDRLDARYVSAVGAYNEARRQYDELVAICL